MNTTLMSGVSAFLARRRRWAIVMIFALLGVSVWQAVSPVWLPNLKKTASINFIEYQLAAGLSPTNIVQGPDSRSYFTVTGSAPALGAINPDGSGVVMYPIPSRCSPNDLVVGPDGNLWFTEPYCNRIGRMGTDGASPTEYPLPAGLMVPWDIVLGSDLSLWFTLQNGLSGTGIDASISAVGRINPTDGSVTSFRLTAYGRPTGITVGPDNNIWVAEPGNQMLARIGSSTGLISEFSVGTNAAELTKGSDGSIWFAGDNQNQIGKLTPTGASGATVTLYGLPASATTYTIVDVVLGQDGNVWYTGSRTDNSGVTTAVLGNFDINGAVQDFPLPAALDACCPRTPRGITSDSFGQIWYTDAYQHLVGHTAATTGQLAVYVLPVKAVTGTAFSGLVAVFFDPAPSSNPADYTASIDWGDGSQASGSIALNGGGGTVTGSHAYATAGSFTVSVRLTRTGFRPLFGSNLARAITHYQVLIQGWIPQPFVVDPLLPIEGISYLSLLAVIDGNCLSINDPLSALQATVTTLFNGNNHVALAGPPGSIKVMGSLDFDWDGTNIKNPAVAKQDGTTDKIKFYSVNGQTRRCQVSKTESSADTTAQVTGPNTFTINIGMTAGKNPFTPPAITPSIRNFVQGTVKPDGSLSLLYLTSGFPSLGIQVTRNGVLADTDITNDVSCLSNSDVRGPVGALLLVTGLGALSNVGTEPVPANAVGLTSSHTGLTCFLKTLINPLSSSQPSGLAAPVAPAAQATAGGSSPAAGSTSSRASASNSTVGAIAGRVTDVSGHSLSHICVRATGLLGPSPVSISITGDDGKYKLFGLAAGTYEVAFQECGGGSHLTQWFNGKAVQAGADRVTVTAGNTTGSVNASLGTGATISGTIRNQTGQVLPGICTHAEDGSGHFADALPSGSLGAYHLGGLLAGTYRLTFFDCSFGDYLVNTAVSPVSVGSSGETRNVDATMVLGGRINGIVTGADGHALFGVCPVALTPDGVPSGFGISDFGGNYTIHALTAGTYAVRFADCLGGNHVPQYWNNKTSASTADLVNVTGGVAVSGINAQLASGGSITGTIRDAAGAPLAGACAVAQSASGGPNSGSSGVTDGTGTYTISALASDTYRVEFFDCTGANHLPLWYNGKPDAGSADPVQVTAGATTSGIDGRLPTGAAFSGHVTATGGSALSNVCVTAYDGNQNPIASGVTDSTGLYSVAGLPGGSYKVEFSDCVGNAHATQWYANKPDPMSATAVQLSLGSTTTGIDAVLALPGSITGHATDSAGHALAGICARAQPAGVGSSGFATTDTNGSYTITGLPAGPYQVAFTDCGQQKYIPQWFGTGSPDQGTAQTVIVAAGSTTTGINATLALGGVISGTVTDGTGAPVAGACVTAVPQSPGSGSPQPTITNANGQYTLPMLPSATYTIQFVDCTGGGRPSASAAGAIQLVAPALVSGVNGQLTAGGSIVGTVTESGSGTPLASVCADAYLANSGGPAAEALTGADGHYQISGLAAGSYFARFSDCVAGTHATQWASNKPDQSSATPITVVSGATVTGIDAILQPPGSLSIGDVTVNRPLSGSSSAIFVVSLAAPSASPVSVDVTTADGTALSQNGDYIPIPLTTLTFQPGEVTKTVTVTIPGHAGHGPNLTFSVHLAQPVNAVLARTSATGTIVSP